ncbi:hypothetical protein TrLO_g8798 [Triparma laevis f. longispina]|uniref:Ion transport domain-containing protein n=1 Tax=Triparma laevis f. longispina TaxID=1714387 RepID=A0A9W7AW79_9STRA|nr:hypothetical protein TrLO_g8798 [Triparma laevis f. longispina]
MVNTRRNSTVRFADAGPGNEQVANPVITNGTRGDGGEGEEPGGLEMSSVMTACKLGFGQDDRFEHTCFKGEQVRKGEGSEDTLVKLKCGSVSPDDRYIVTGTNNGKVYYQRAGDPKGEKNMVVISKARGVEVHFLQFRHTSDTSCVVCVGTWHKTDKSCHRLTVIDLLDPSKTFDFEDRHDCDITGLAFSKCGDTLISTSKDWTAQIYNLSPKGDGISGKLNKIISHDEEVYSVAISLVNFCLGVGGKGKIFVYNLNNFEELFTLEAHKNFILRMVFSKNGGTLFTGSRDCTVKVWNSVACTNAPSARKSKRGTGHASHGDTTRRNSITLPGLSFGTSFKMDNPDETWTLKMTLIGHIKDVVNISESPCGKFICSSSKDSTIRVWDLENGVELRTITRHTGSVWGLSFLRTGRKIISASADGQVKLWNLDPQLPKSKKLKGHENQIKNIDITSDGKTVVSCSTDKTIRVWDLESRKCKLTCKGHSQAATCVAVSDDGKFISGSADKTVRIWNQQDGTEAQKIEFGDCVEAVAFSPNKKSFFVVGDSGFVKQYDTNTKSGKETRKFEGHKERVWSVAVTSDGFKLATGDGNGDIIIWNTHNGGIIRRLDKAHSDRVRGLAITPEDKQLISGSWDSTAKIWNMNDGKLLHTLLHPDQLFDVAIHYSGKFFATASKDHTWKLWSLVSRELIYTSHDAHKDEVRSVKFSIDGMKLISGSFDKTINIEDITHHLNQLPSSVIEHTFKADRLLESKSPKDYNWATSSTALSLQRRPLALVEPSWHAKKAEEVKSNLVHVAAKEGCSNFLAFALNNKNNSKMQKLAFFAALSKDSKGRTPLSLALKAESSPTVKVLLDCYSLLLSPEYAVPFTPQHSFQEPHPTELFPLDDFCHALKVFPALALKFVSKLSLVSSGDYKVQGNLTRSKLGKHYEARLVAPSQSRVPHDFWKERLRKHDDDTAESGDRVTAKFVPIKNIAGPSNGPGQPNFLEFIIDAAIATGNYTVFENQVVNVIIEHKWNTYAKRMFLKNFALDVLLVALLTADVLTYASAAEWTDWNYALPSLVFVLWLYFAMAEFHQVRVADNLWDHFRDIWNVGDFLSLFSIALGYAFRFSSLNYLSTTAFAFALPLTYLNSLYFMQGFRESGKLVRMIIRIIQNIRYFLVVLTICITGFSFAFYTLYKASETEKEIGGSVEVDDGGQNQVPVYGLDSPFKSLFPPFFMMLGSFDPFEFEASLSPATTLILFVCFMIIINIVMMNLLIAIMGDTFDQIQENAMAEYLFCRASIILEFEEAMSKDRLENIEWFPSWLQVLVPTMNFERDKEWDGRIRSIQRAVKEGNENAKKSTGEEFNVLKENFAKDLGILQDRLDASEKSRAEEQKEMKQLLEKLIAGQEMAVDLRLGSRSVSGGGGEGG